MLTFTILNYNDKKIKIKRLPDKIILLTSSTYFFLYKNIK